MKLRMYFFHRFRATSKSNGPWQILPGDSDTSYTIYGLIPDTEYEVRILSRNSMGDGMYSDAVVGSTLGRYMYVS